MIRHISHYEALFLASLLQFPELVYSFEMRKDDFSGEFPLACYQALFEADPQDLKDNGALVVLTELRKKELITRDEWAYIMDGFNLTSAEVTSYTPQYAYRKIKNETTKFEFTEKLNRIMENKESEFKEKMFELKTLVFDTEGVFIRENTPTYLSDIKNISTADKVASWGIPKLDRMMPIAKHHYNVIAARPFNGKTSFALNAAMFNTIYGKVLFYSLEIKAERVKEILEHYGAAYKPENLLFVFKTQISLQEITADATKYQPIAIFIDQFNKIKYPGKINIFEKFTAINNDLKILAGTLNIPIFCLAQAHRDADNAQPHLSNIKNSGSFEEECDNGITLWVKDRDNRRMVISVEKNRGSRFGYLGEVDMVYDPETNFFREA